eukprot:PLAT7612.1.p1 GENE.PLAT7612.1~~PLAT7612.1.p1  ORF type:complete len:1000 (-),score=422.99 PLAT7612.1:74-3073(-)
MSARHKVAASHHPGGTSTPRLALSTPPIDALYARTFLSPRPQLPRAPAVPPPLPAGAGGVLPRKPATSSGRRRQGALPQLQRRSHSSASRRRRRDGERRSEDGSASPPSSKSVGHMSSRELSAASAPPVTTAARPATGSPPADRADSLSSSVASAPAGKVMRGSALIRSVFGDGRRRKRKRKAGDQPTFWERAKGVIEEEKLRITAENTALSSKHNKLQARLQERLQLYRQKKQELQSARRQQAEFQGAAIGERWGGMDALEEQVAEKDAQYEMALFRRRQLMLMLERLERATDLLRRQVKDLAQSHERGETSVGYVSDYLESRVQVKAIRVKQLEALQAQLAARKQMHHEMLQARRTAVEDLKLVREMKGARDRERRHVGKSVEGQLSRVSKDKMVKDIVGSDLERSVLRRTLAADRKTEGMFQKTMRKVQVATGILDINDVADKFFSQDSRLRELEEERAACVASGLALEEEIAALRQQCNHIRAFGVDSSEQDSKIAMKEDELRRLQEDSRRQAAELARMEKLSSDIAGGVSSLMLRCGIMYDMDDTVEDGAATGLLDVEARLQDLLQQLADSKASGSFPAALAAAAASRESTAGISHATVTSLSVSAATGSAATGGAAAGAAAGTAATAAAAATTAAAGTTVVRYRLHDSDSDSELPRFVRTTVAVAADDSGSGLDMSLSAAPPAATTTVATPATTAPAAATAATAGAAAASPADATAVVDGDVTSSSVAAAADPLMTAEGSVPLILLAEPPMDGNVRTAARRESAVTTRRLPSWRKRSSRGYAAGDGSDGDEDDENDEDDSVSGHLGFRLRDRAVHRGDSDADDDDNDDDDSADDYTDSDEDYDSVPDRATVKKSAEDSIRQARRTIKRRKMKRAPHVGPLTRRQRFLDEARASSGRQPKSARRRRRRAAFSTAVTPSSTPSVSPPTSTVASATASTPAVSPPTSRSTSTLYSRRRRRPGPSASASSPGSASRSYSHTRSPMARTSSRRRHAER